MSGKSPVSASEGQRSALAVLAGSRDRGEADRARAILLTLSGWTSPRIAEAFSVREDTVRLWRSDFSRGGTDALKAGVAPGPPPVKSETALRVVTPLLEEPVANRPNWTIARMRAEIEAREGVGISRSQLSPRLSNWRTKSRSESAASAKVLILIVRSGTPAVCRVGQSIDGRQGFPQRTLPGTADEL